MQNFEGFVHAPTKGRMADGTSRETWLSDGLKFGGIEAIEAEADTNELSSVGVSCC